MVEEHFAGDDLDSAVWVASYLPAWSSRAAAAATYALGPDGLRLSIPAEQPLWCPDLHDDPVLKVSAVQSGNWSGPAGSTQGQQPFRQGLTVREAQPELRGPLTFRYGRLEVECRATIGPSAMFSAWTIGMEDAPERCGELCLVEVFGDSIEGGTAAVGCGVHAFRDPALTEEWSAERRRIDVAGLHTYAVDWRPDGVDFLIDGERVRSTRQSPGYPMLLILGVFEFPGRAPASGTPELVVRRVTRA